MENTNKKQGVNDVFFGEAGVTSSSANRTAERAKEWYEVIERELESMHFYTTSLSVIGSDKIDIISKGWTKEQLDEIKEKVNKIILAKKLISYLRETVKAKAKMDNDLSNLKFQDWAAMNNIELPVRPEVKYAKTREDILSEMTIKERCRIFELECEAACYGKLIHKYGSLSNARDLLNKKLQQPTDVVANGRDTLIYTYEETVSPEMVEDLFFEMNQCHNKAQAELNGLNAKIDKEIDADEIRVNNEHLRETGEYNRAIAELEAQFFKYVKDERTRVRALNIIIPNHLKGVYDMVNQLGKKK